MTSSFYWYCKKKLHNNLPIFQIYGMTIRLSALFEDRVESIFRYRYQSRVRSMGMRASFTSDADDRNDFGHAVTSRIETRTSSRVSSQSRIERDNDSVFDDTGSGRQTRSTESSASSVNGEESDEEEEGGDEEEESSDEEEEQGEGSDEGEDEEQDEEEEEEDDDDEEDDEKEEDTDDSAEL